ncbi:MAG: WD40 repeat domain-containing protein [Sporichthyaceae bacterium]
MSLVGMALAEQIAWRLSVDDSPVALAATPEQVVVGGAEGLVWRAEIGDVAAAEILRLAGGVLQVALSPSGRAIAATGPLGHAVRSSAGTLAMSDTGAWSATAVWSSERAVAIASGSRALVCNEAGVVLWSTAPAPSTVTDLCWLRDGRRLAVASYNAVRCHERHQAEPVVSYDYVGSHLVVAAASTGKYLCSGNQDASIHIWRIRDAHEMTMSGYRSKISRIAFDPSGRWLAADGGPEITVWDFDGKGPAGRYPRILACHRAITAFAWRPAGPAQLASGGSEGIVALWAASTGTEGKDMRPVREFDLGESITALSWAGPALLIAADRSGTVTALRVPPGPLV